MISFFTNNTAVTISIILLQQIISFLPTFADFQLQISASIFYLFNVKNGIPLSLCQPKYLHLYL